MLLYLNLRPSGKCVVSHKTGLFDHLFNVQLKVIAEELWTLLRKISSLEEANILKYMLMYGPTFQEQR
jgi:hypothetical protein